MEQALQYRINRPFYLKLASGRLYARCGGESTSSLVSCKMSLEERAILTQDEPEGGEVVQAGG